MPILFLSFIGIKTAKSQIDSFLLENLTMVHWIRLSLLCRCNWTRKFQVSGNMFQGNIDYFMNIEKVYCVYRRNLCSSIFVYGILSLSMEFPSMSMEFHLCLWSSIFVYGVLSLSMEFYLCLRSSFFVCGCWVHVYGNVWVWLPTDKKFLTVRLLIVNI